MPRLPQMLGQRAHGGVEREEEPLAQLHALADGYGKSTYGAHLKRVADGRIIY